MRCTWLRLSGAAVRVAVGRVFIPGAENVDHTSASCLPLPRPEGAGAAPTATMLSEADATACIEKLPCPASEGLLSGVQTSPSSDVQTAAVAGPFRPLGWSTPTATKPKGTVATPCICWPLC